MAVLPEAIVEYTMNGAAPPRDGNRDPHMAPHGVFRAAGEDRWLALAIEDDAAWRRFAHVIGQPALADDPRFATLAARKRHEDELEDAGHRLDRGARRRDAAAATLQAAGIPAFVAATNRDLAEDPHLAARGFPVDAGASGGRHPDAPRHPVAHVGERLPGAPRRARASVQDTDQVLRDVCGYAPDEIAPLRDSRRPHLGASLNPRRRAARRVRRPEAVADQRGEQPAILGEDPSARTR